ncbi:MAG: tetratricopeptide repeat protein [Actinomycetes bacterium]
MDEELGQRLRRLRLEAGLSQTQLAGENLSPSYVSLIESGRRRPTHEVAAILAERLGCSVTMILEGREPASTQAATLALNLASLSLNDGRAGDAQAQFRALLEDESVPQEIRDDARLGVARSLERLGNLDEAIAELTPLYERAVTGETGIPITSLGIMMCGYSVDAGDLHRAVDIGEQAMRIAEDRGLVGTEDHLRLAATLMAAYHDRGDLTHAAAFAERWLPVAERVGSRAGQGSIYWNAAIVADARGDVEQAARYSSRALGHLSEGDDTRDLSRLRVACAWLWLRLDEPLVHRAIDELERARPDLERWGSGLDLAYWCTARAQAEVLRGDGGAAVRYAREALEHLAPQPGIETCQALIVLGDALRAAGDTEESLSTYHQAASLLLSLPARRDSADCWRALGDRLLRDGDAADAAAAYRRALDHSGVRSSFASLDRVLDVAPERDARTSHPS